MNVPQAYDTMSTTVLVIDDDTTLNGLIAEYLEKAGYRSVTASSGLTGLQAFYEHHPDLVVLDVMMPKMDGWKVCERIREVFDVPLIMLTAKGEECDRLRGFQLGVDDYVIKPFSFAELTARIKVILARGGRTQSDTRPQVLDCKNLSIDFGERRVWRDGQLVHLTPTEFRLLAVLAETPGRTLSPSTLLTRVWGSEYFNLENVKRYIHYLRQKLENDPENPELIITDRGFGYYLTKQT
jgi:two-component system KDP operon response regulator KdpE